MNYQRPSAISRTQTIVSNSRFTCIIDQACSVTEAREFIAEIRAEMPDASHHVYAFRVGFGNTVIEGMSDDGEPSGTAGPPLLAVLRGTALGDIVMVVVRYFGGTKLGTGGLVRAYTESAQDGLKNLPTEYNITKKTIGVDIPYSLYEQTKRLIHACEGVIEDEFFEGQVTLILKMPVYNIQSFETNLTELTNGQIGLVQFD
jgi:uncharacterized YigZ family protein